MATGGRMTHPITNSSGKPRADNFRRSQTQERPRPMEGAADRGEVRPGLAAPFYERA